MKRLLCALSVFVLGASSVEAKTVVKFATVAPANTPWADSIKTIQTHVKKSSKGSIKVKAYLGGQLGGELEILQGVRRGRIQGAGLTSGALASAIPELDVLEIPYLFDSTEEADFILDRYLFDAFKKIFEKRGLILVSWAENGWRNIGTRSKPVRSPKDLKGVKVRSQESKSHIAFWKAMGALANPIAVTEVLPALQTGLVDGFDNTPLFTLAAEWHTAIKYYSVTEHIYQPAAIVYGAKFWKKMSPANRKILYGDGNAQALAVRAGVRALGAELLSVLKETGVEVYQLSEKEKGMFKKAVEGLPSSLVKDIGGEAERIFKLIQQGKAAFSKR